MIVLADHSVVASHFFPDLRYCISLEVHGRFVRVCLERGDMNDSSSLVISTFMNAGIIYLEQISLRTIQGLEGVWLHLN